jgi:hypothetical protein
MLRILGLASGVLFASGALAACPGDGEIGAYVADWTANRPARALPVENMADAACARDKVVAALERAAARSSVTRRR